MTVTAKRRRRTTTAASADPVTAYARAAVGGAVIVGRSVRLACERHLRDLERQRTAAFPYYFNAAAARHIIEFFPTFLTLESGEPFVLTDWLQFSLGSLFGWKREADERRRFQVGYIETAKGSGKSPTLAGVGLYCLAFDDEPAAEIYSAAFDKGQASIILNDAIRMAGDSPDLSEMLDIGKYNIAHPESGSFFRATSSEHRSKSGPRPSVVLIDELHEHRDATVVTKLVAGFKFRKQPLQLEITNSGSDRAGICWQHHEKSLKVVEGALADEQWFAYVCQLDPCEAHRAEGHTAPVDGCHVCDDWTNPAVWPKVNPSLGVILQPSYLASQVNTAQTLLSEQAMVKRLNFCIWTEAHTIWIHADRWHACARPAVSERNDGRACAVGFDMSEKIDLTSGVVALRVEDEAERDADTIELVDMIGEQEVRNTFDLNFSIELVPFFWIPEETLRARVQHERIPYDVWAKAGRIRVTPGPVIDHDQIFREFTTDIGPRFRPQRVGYDAHNATQFAVQLRDKAKYTVVDVPQGRKLSETFKLFEALVLLRRIRHDGNPVMGFCVSNAEPKRDRYQNLWIEKPSRTKRIDGLIAAVIAISQLVLLPKRAPKRRGALVYTPGGFVSALPQNEPADAPATR